MRRGKVILTLLLLALLVPGGRVRAQEVPWRDDPFLSSLPADSEVAVIVRNGTGQRQAPAARALFAMLSETGAFAGTGLAWEELARTLDWPADRAFDELLGRMVTLVVREVDAPVRDWAVLTQVSPETERRLRSKLSVVPRASAEGFTVLAVENGKFELTVGHPPEGIEGAAGAVCTILIAPAGEEKLFRALLPAVRTSLQPTASPRGRDLVLLLREGAAAGTVRRSLLLSAASQANGWDLDLRCSPGMTWARPDGVELRPWTDSLLRAVDRGALFAAVGVSGSAPMEIAGALRGAWSMAPSVPQGLLASAPGQRVCVAVCREGARGGGGSGGLLSIGVASEATSATLATAERDRTIAAAIHLLTTGEAAPAPDRVLPVDPSPEDYLEHRVNLDDAVALHESMAPRVERVFGPSPTLSWIVGHAPPAGRRASEPAPRAWWAAGLSPNGSPTAQRLLSSLSQPEHGPAQLRLSTGIVRPGAIFRWTGPESSALDALRPLKRLESLSWDAWLRPDGLIQATISVRMEPSGNGAPTEPPLAGEHTPLTGVHSPR